MCLRTNRANAAQLEVNTLLEVYQRRLAVVFKILLLFLLPTTLLARCETTSAHAYSQFPVHRHPRIPAFFFLILSLRMLTFLFLAISTENTLSSLPRTKQLSRKSVVPIVSSDAKRVVGICLDTHTPSQCYLRRPLASDAVLELYDRMTNTDVISKSNPDFPHDTTDEDMEINSDGVDGAFDEEDEYVFIILYQSNLSRICRASDDECFSLVALCQHDEETVLHLPTAVSKG